MKKIKEYFKGIENICNFYNIELIDTDIKITNKGYLINILLKEDTTKYGFTKLINNHFNIATELYKFETKLNEELNKEQQNDRIN